MITIKRIESDQKHGTVGKLFIDGELVAYTMEQPDNGNKPFESCIPQGEYDLIPWESSRYGSCFIAVNPDLNVYEKEASEGRPENGRFKCLFFHRGNYARNFQGCCGAGKRLIQNNGPWMVTDTRNTCERINQMVKDEGSLKLHIDWNWG